MVSVEEVYDYIDNIRSIGLHTDYIDDICNVVVDYHKCGCRGRLFGIDEIMNATDDINANEIYQDIFFRNGLEMGLRISVSMARVILFRKLNSICVLGFSLEKPFIN